MKLPVKIVEEKRTIETINDFEIKNKALLTWWDSVHSWLYTNDKRFRWIEDNLKIKDKETGRIIAWRFNIPQMIVYMKIREMEENNLPIRLIILKARQEGISTFIEGLLFYNACNNQGYNGMIIAHTAKASDIVFRMSKRFYAFLSNSPRTDYSNRKEILFSAPLSSEITIDMANKNRLSADEIGRASNIHGLHASEVSSWNEPEDVMKAVLNAIPNTPNTMVVVESTAKGASGYFHDLYWKAKNKETDFQAIFLGWQLDPRNRMIPPDNFIFSSEDLKVKETYKLDNAQLYWRYWTIRNKHNGDVEGFEQENPAADVEAFKTSGGSVFCKQSLNYYFGRTKKGIRGNLEKLSGELVFVPDSKGYITLFEEPLKNGEYISGGDVAEGLEKGDYSCAYMMNKVTGNISAVWHGKIDPDLYAEELEKFYHFYNDAFAGVENNNHGFTVLNRLKQTYPYLYSEWIEGQWFEEYTERIGWHTNMKTRRLMVDAGKEWVRDKHSELYDEFLLKEMTTFTTDEKGKATAKGTAHDDRVMAFLITIMMYERCPLKMKGDYVKPKRELTTEVAI